MASKRAILEKLEHALKLLKDAGAERATATYSESSSINVGIRRGNMTELNVTPNSAGMSLTVRIGDKTAGTNPDTQRPDLLAEMARATVAAAHLKTANPDQRDPDHALLSRIRNNRSLDLYDSSKPSIESLVASLHACEAAVPRVAQNVSSDGASAHWQKSRVFSLSSDGDLFEDQRSINVLSISTLGEENGYKTTDSAYTQARHLSDLRDPALIGRLAAEKAVAALNPREAMAGQFPVVFSPELAGGLLSSFNSAAAGSAIMMKQSFLTPDHLGQRVCAPGITITDDPHKLRGMNSGMYNGDGLPTRSSTIVENGVLKALFLGVESARRLQFPLTHITGSDSNLMLAAGPITPAKLMEDITDGFYVTNVMGQGVNTSTGQYSRGASGFWIKNGVLAYPVVEATIAGNLRDMFMNMQAASDLDDHGKTKAAPTLRIEGMMVA